MRKRISILIVLTAMLSGGCLLADAVGRLGNIPDHCTFENVPSGSWLELRGGCSFDNPLDALAGK